MFKQLLTIAGLTAQKQYHHLSAVTSKASAALDTVVKEQKLDTAFRKDLAAFIAQGGDTTSEAEWTQYLASAATPGETKTDEPVIFVPKRS